MIRNILRNSYNACGEIEEEALIAFDFDSSGNFLGTSWYNSPSEVPREQTIDPTVLLPMPSSTDSLMCVEAQSEGVWLFDIISSTALAASRFSSGQCTDWLDQQYPELIKACLPSSGADAHTWDNHFIERCNFPVSGEPQVGDIAVWEIDSNDPPLRPAGHVAYVTSISGDDVTVSEYNVGEIAEYATRGERPPNSLSGTYPISGLEFIHVSEGLPLLARTAEVVPVRVEGRPSFVLVRPECPEDRQPGCPLEEDIDQGLFVYRGREGWDGVFFSKLGEENDSLLFLVDSQWEIDNPGWYEYYMRYVYLAYPN